MWRVISPKLIGVKMEKNFFRNLAMSIHLPLTLSLSGEVLTVNAFDLVQRISVEKAIVISIKITRKMDDTSNFESLQDSNLTNNIVGEMVSLSKS